MRLERISTFTLEKFRKHCAAKGLSASTVNQLLATYRHMGRKLLEWGDISFPLPVIKLEPVENRRDYVLDEDEKARLLEAAMVDVNAYVWLFIIVALHTSLRHREILRARFDHLDVGRRRLRVRVKGGRLREQPLTRAITKVLEREREMSADPDGWVFPNSRSASGHYESMKAPFRRAVEAAGLNPNDVTPHVLRHTAITDMAETGAEVQTVQDFSGHRTVDMVMRYIHAREVRVNEALDKFENQRTRNERAGKQKWTRS